MHASERELIRDVSDTALWVAMYRALESERRDALFHDPHARRLAGERGAAILAGMPQARAWSWPMVVRTRVFDELVTRAVREEGFDTVLNLAAGLDTRAWRLDLPGSTRWFDVDMPAMIDYMRNAMAGERPRVDHQSVAADLRRTGTRQEVFREAARGGRRVLVVTEGLLVYLEPEQVGALARDLAAEPEVERWLTDLASPALLAWMLRRRFGPRGITNAPFRFAPEQGSAFFEPFGWREREFLSTMHEARRLKRTFPFAWVGALLTPFLSAARRETMRRFSGFAVLERIRR